MKKTGYKAGISLIIVGFLILIAYVLYQILSIIINMAAVVVIAIVAMILGFIIVLISMIIERRRDIKKGEDDDISKY